MGPGRAFRAGRRRVLFNGRGGIVIKGRLRAGALHKSIRNFDSQRDGSEPGGHFPPCSKRIRF